MENRKPRLTLLHADFNFIYGAYLDGVDEPIMYVQSDWDRPNIAKTFGWKGIKCRGCGRRSITYTACNCKHITVSDLIARSTDWLDKNIGKQVVYHGDYDSE